MGHSLDVYWRHYQLFQSDCYPLLTWSLRVRIRRMAGLIYGSFANIFI